MKKFIRNTNRSCCSCFTERLVSLLQQKQNQVFSTQKNKQILNVSVWTFEFSADPESVCQTRPETNSELIRTLSLILTRLKHRLQIINHTDTNIWYVSRYINVIDKVHQSGVLVDPETGFSAVTDQNMFLMEDRLISWLTRNHIRRLNVEIRGLSPDGRKRRKQSEAAVSCSGSIQWLSDTYIQKYFKTWW